MRHPIISAAVFLLGIAGFTSAQTPVESAPQPATSATPVIANSVTPSQLANATVCLAAQIDVVAQKSDQPLRLNDWLTLIVSGACKSDVETQLAQSNAPPGAPGQSSGISLLLNDVIMQNLPMVAAQADDPSQMLLSFRLQRDSENADSRQSWDTFLRNGESCCEAKFDLKEMGVTIALAIGNRPAAALGAGSEIQFRVEDRRVVAWTFWVLLIVFVVGYALCIRSPSLLRDAPNGSYSLAKSQMAFWGLIVALSFAGTWFVIGTMEQIPDDVLILLGISAVTGWLAPFAGASSESAKMADLNTQQQQAQAAVASATATAQSTEAHTAKLSEISASMLRLTARTHLKEIEGFLRDICSDGDGIGVHRVQAVAWTLILGVVFVCEVATVISMPVFADNLLLLLGISNGTYLTMKTREQP